MSQYPISYVVSETGVNPITLRAWESRYQLILPTRTLSGHRLYSQDDIDKIKEILYLKSKGFRISQINEQLNKSKNKRSEETQKVISVIVASLRKFDQVELRIQLKHLIRLSPIEVFADKVYPLLLEELKRAIWNNSIYFTQERAFFYDQLRSVLQQYYEQYTTPYFDFQIKIIGFQAPKEISEFYVNNLFCAIQLCQYQLTNCLINHIDSFEEIVQTAKHHPKKLIICNMGSPVYQFQQCVKTVASQDIANLLFHHANISLTDLTSRESKHVLPASFHNKISVIRHVLTLIEQTS